MEYHWKTYWQRGDLNLVAGISQQHLLYNHYNTIWWKKLLTDAGSVPALLVNFFQ